MGSDQPPSTYKSRFQRLLLMPFIIENVWNFLFRALIWVFEKTWRFLEQGWGSSFLLNWKILFWAKFLLTFQRKLWEYIDCKKLMNFQHLKSHFLKLESCYFLNLNSGLFKMFFWAFCPRLSTRILYFVCEFKLSQLLKIMNC